TAVTVDPIPHDLAYKPADRLEARHAIKFRRTDRHVVSLTFVDELAAFLYVGLAAAGRDARVCCHLLHECFEVAWRQTQIEIELAEIVVVVGVDRAIAV